MSRYLALNPQIVEGKHVLELGSGTGIVGLTALKHCGARVTFTDYTEQITNLL